MVTVILFTKIQLEEALNFDFSTSIKCKESKAGSFNIIFLFIYFFAWEGSGMFEIRILQS